MAQREVVIVDAVRTAFGRMGGTLKDIYCSKLGTIGIDGLLQKTKIMDKAHVDSVFLGSATGCSQSGNPARHAMLGSALGYETSASYVEMQCGSAIDSINHAAWKILANQADIIIAGGMESYSQMAQIFHGHPPFKLIPPMPIPPRAVPGGRRVHRHGHHRGKSPGNVRHSPGGLGRIRLQQPDARQSRHGSRVVRRRDRPGHHPRPPARPLKSCSRWTNTRVPKPPSKGWPSCRRFSKKRAPSRPGTHRARTTARPSC
jgi:hypothetical protein